jgi:hypothetical protein
VGAATSRWPDPENDGPAGSRAPMCEQHTAEVAAARCAHCARAACLACLVYMPAEVELWCVTCAEDARST